MHNLEKRIADLEEEIDGYRAECKTVSHLSRKNLLLNLICVRTETLNKLLAERQKSAPNGM